MQVQIVAPEYVCQIWESIRTYFEEAEAVGVDDCTTEQLKLQLVSGAQVLIVVVDDDKIVGAASICISAMPNHRVATVTAAGGKGVICTEVFEQIVKWAKSHGATKIRAWANESRARLYRQKIGLVATTTVVEKLI